MTNSAQTIRNSIAQFRADNGLNQNEEKQAMWMAQLGHFTMPLPNFKWRAELINRHDAHHLLTGYPTSPKGELTLAAWELGVSCYKDPRARALCRMLMIFGLITIYQDTRDAFDKGQSQSKAYAKLLEQGFLDMSLEQAQMALNS